MLAASDFIARQEIADNLKSDCNLDTPVRVNLVEHLQAV